MENSELSGVTGNSDHYHSVTLYDASDPRLQITLYLDSWCLKMTLNDSEFESETENSHNFEIFKISSFESGVQESIPALSLQAGGRQPTTPTDARMPLRDCYNYAA